MKIKIIVDVPAKVEVDGTKYAVSPLWYDTQHSTEGVIGAVHRSSTSTIDYFVLSDPFEKQSDLHEAYASGFNLVETERARRIATALVAAGLAEVLPDA